MDDVRAPALAALGRLGIEYELFEHPPVFSAEDAAVHWQPLNGTPVKNLFLRNKKGNRHYLVMLPIDKEADLPRLVKVTGDDRFSFASPDRLRDQLGLTPGSVSPFGLLNNPSRSVDVIVDAEIRGAAPLILHPNLNSHSVTITGDDLARFLSSTGHRVRWLAL